MEHSLTARRTTSSRRQRGNKAGRNPQPAWPGSPHVHALRPLELPLTILRARRRRLAARLVEWSEPRDLYQSNSFVLLYTGYGRYFGVHWVLTSSCRSSSSARVDFTNPPASASIVATENSLSLRIDYRDVLCHR